MTLNAPLRLLAAVLPFLASAAPAAPSPEVAVAPADAALVSIEGPSPGLAALLLDERVMVVRDMERYLLAVATERDRQLLARLGVTWRELDRTVGGRAYYTVTLPAARTEGLQERVRVLRSDGWDAVIEAPPAEAEALAGLGFEIARVFLRPIRVRRTLDAGGPPARALLTPDPAVQAVVDAVSSVRINADVQRLQDFVTRYAAHDSCGAAAEYIKAQFVAAGIDSVYLQPWSATYHDNVVAVIPGRANPERIVVVGGHYDSYTSNVNVCPGADDDASGTACVLECARVLAGTDFNYTLKFVAFCGEELGLLGSEAFAAAAAAAGDDIVAAICVDMIGYVAAGDVVDLDLIDNASSTWLRDLAVEAGAAYVPALSVVDGALPGGASSDHASFWAHGYDALLFFEDTGSYSPYIHTSSDVVGVSYNHPVLAERSVKLAAAVLATVADPFDVAISHVPLGDTEDTENAYALTAEILTATALDPDSLRVRYTTGGPVQDVPLLPAGPPDLYEGAIPAQSGGTWVDYWLTAADTEGHVTTDPPDAPASTHRFFVGTITTVLLDEMETASGFTVGDAGDNATTGIWVRGDPHGTWSGSVPVQPEDDHTPSGTMCWITGNANTTSQGTDDVDGGKTTLKSPSYDLSAYASASVRYYRWYTNDTGAAPETDVWQVDVSYDGGTSWSVLELLGSSDRTWRLVEKELAQCTSAVRFRFVAADNEPGSIVEAGLDDLSIVVYESGATAAPVLPGVAAGRIALLPNEPNPFGAGTTLRFVVPPPGRSATVRVFDVTGRLVATLLDDEVVSGPRAVAWDGTDAAGRPLASGVYFCRLEAGEERASRRLVLLR